MDDHFHEIHSHITTLKGCRGHKFLSRQMQKTESSIIIDHVCYNAIGAGLKFAQIYDSILCLEEDVDFIKNLITEGFKKHNLNVSLEVE